MPEWDGQPSGLWRDARGYWETAERSLTGESATMLKSRLPALESPKNEVDYWGEVLRMLQNSLTLRWWTCEGNTQWCGLETVNLSNLTIEGVYLIWHSGTKVPPAKWLYVGQGNIRGRLEEHRRDHRILQYREHGTLLTSWAYVLPDYRNGVERFLAEACNPILGHQWPETVPVSVNLPQ